MKDTNPKSHVKAAKKAAAADIEISLLAALKNMATKLGQNAKHIEKEIEKGAKKLAKKIAKEMEFAKPAAPKKDIVIKPTAKQPKTVAKTPIKVATPVAAKSVAKKAAPAQPAVAAAKTVKKA
jgi:hypothetical protein